MSRHNKIERNNIPVPEANILVDRMLKMVKDRDNLFTCISDDIINSLLLEDLIEIDVENETMSGTTLTEKGKYRLSQSIIL